MGENSKIEWTDHTFNPWIGCTKVHAGCANCYAESMMDKRWQRVQWGPNGTRVVAAESAWRNPIKWNREAEKSGRRARVFCASLADVFEDWQGPMFNANGSQLYIERNSGCVYDSEIHEGCDPLTMGDCRRQVFALIDATPWLDWILVTKRPENVPGIWRIPANGRDPSDPLVLRRDNVMLLTSVSDQATADKQIDPLLGCRDLVRIVGLSVEPLLGPLDLGLRNWAADYGLGWVIVGGESGLGARPMHPDWVRFIRDDCNAAGVPFFFKQWGEWFPTVGANTATVGGKYCYGAVEGVSMLRTGDVCVRTPASTPAGPSRVVNEFALSQFDRFCRDESGFGDPGYQWMHRVGKEKAGRLLDGRIHSEFPFTEVAA